MQRGNNNPSAWGSSLCINKERATSTMLKPPVVFLGAKTLFPEILSFVLLCKTFVLLKNASVSKRLRDPD